MINSVQHAYVLAKNYHYDKREGKYCITLKFIFYDVFGLDDDDLAEYDLSEYGGRSGSVRVPVLLPPIPVPIAVSVEVPAAAGIIAWWQLQHQHGYKPLVTRIVVEKTYEVPAI